ncbi:hypothetical protein GCM10010326_73840 [Streptomyces xanthochromogenes]|uniref:Integral membrane protein n=1 Tax=Streptomyces xanthochromogenes TaxID=67384 RepID=A0ABQ3AWT8_9ACTN|nr:hypothetical protein GCM10010326_73840 [Streptomyces xanthochromogenes]
MGARLPTGGYRGAPGPDRPPRGGAPRPGYPGRVSTEQTPEASAEPRPGRLTAAAALSALEGLALVAGGLFMLVMGLTGKPDKPTQAEMGGLTLVVLGLIPLIAARGLLRRRSWSRGPAMITQIMALPVAWMFLNSDGAPWIPAGIALAAVAITGLVLLVNPATTEALGIRGPMRDA